jgi:multidrug resistance efflux pump
MRMDRKAYESKLDEELARWKADIDLIKAKGKRAEVEAMDRYDQAIDALQRKHEEAETQLRRLKTASDEAWEGLKDRTEEIWLEFKALFQGAGKKD